MKSPDFLPHPNPPPSNDSPAANGEEQLPAEPEQRKSWLSEAFDWALAVGGFWLIHNHFYPTKKDD